MGQCRSHFFLGLIGCCMGSICSMGTMARKIPSGSRAHLPNAPVKESRRGRYDGVSSQKCLCDTGKLHLTCIQSTTFLIGFPFVAIVINIPQRAQAVNGYSPVKAGLALLALLLSSPSATAVSGVLTSSFKVPPIYLILIGAVLQVIGVGLTISLPTTGGPFPKQQYGFEVIMGLGFGLILATVLTLAQLVCDEKDIGTFLFPMTNIITLP